MPIYNALFFTQMKHTVIILSIYGHPVRHNALQQQPFMLVHLNKSQVRKIHVSCFYVPLFINRFSDLLETVNLPKLTTNHDQPKC